ncbi:hypothetical protein [Alkalihalobacterium bogoriense]|uniref:hypothetical protein n=1 Tax=Alkalihalobacterium bogoriense TaxID=246272 RepID=UPI00047C1D6C|nr:hypothetical protein [Alkalihalobacterium bogoriense]
MMKMVNYFGVGLYVFCIAALLFQLNLYKTTQLIEGVIFVTLGFIIYFILTFVYFKVGKGKTIVPVTLAVIGVISLVGAVLVGGAH